MKYDWDEYAGLCRAFLRGDLAPADFQDRYLVLWRRDRDATYAQAEAWPERYDIILQRQLSAGEITGDEFSRRWYELWGVSAEEVPRLQQIDQLMTAVNEFDSDPATSGAYCAR